MKKLMMMIATMIAAGGAFAAGALTTVSDMRVAPLVETHWGQGTANGAEDGARCFDYYLNGTQLKAGNLSYYPAGCSATTLAQLLYYHRDAFTPGTGDYKCSVDDAIVELSMMGGTYNWDAMVTNTTALTADDTAACEAIGKLVYDCAVSLRSAFTATNTAAGANLSFVPLTQTFGFQNAFGYTRETGLSIDEINRTIIPNLDAGYPVIVCFATVGASIDESHNVAGGHCALADGYGYEGGVLYVHLNMGRLGQDDGWYSLVDSSITTPDTGKKYGKLWSVTYNIFPDKGNVEIISGTVTDKNGLPVPAATVESTDGKYSAKSDDNGNFVLFVAAPRTYTASGQSYDLTIVAPDMIQKSSISVKVFKSENSNYNLDLTPGVGYFDNKNLPARLGNTKLSGGRADGDQSKIATLDVTAVADFENPVMSDYDGIYDGKPHISRLVADNAAGADNYYSLTEDGEYSTKLAFSNVTETTTVYFRSQKKNFIPVTGSFTVTIAPKALDASMIADIPDQPYTGTEVIPELVVSDVANITTNDWSVEFKDNLELGVATATFTGFNNYSGTVEKVFNIVQPGGEIEIDPLTINGQYGLFTLSTQVAGGVIYFTTDGSEPTNESDPYTEPIMLGANDRIRAVLYVNGAPSTNQLDVVVRHITNWSGEGTVTYPKTLTVGRAATWTAKAAKGSVFSHWEGDAVTNLTWNEQRNPSLKLTATVGMNTNDVSAVFIPIDLDNLTTLAIDNDSELEVTNVYDFVLMDDSQSYVTASVSGLPSGLKFNAKTLHITGTPTKPGVYPILLKAKNASGYNWQCVVTQTVAGVSSSKPTEKKAVLTTYYPLTIRYDATMGTTTGTGVYATNKVVSISARANRGYSFAGWYWDPEYTIPADFGDNIDYRTSAHKVKVPDVRYLFARFVSATASGDPIESVIVSDDSGAITNNTITLRVGVALPTEDNAYGIEFDCASLPTLSASGLPKGVTFNKKDGTFGGIPAAAGTYTTIIKITNASKTTEQIAVTFVVQDAETWAYGTYNGGNGSTPQNSATITITKVGKITGKVNALVAGVNTVVTLTGAAYTAEEEFSGETTFVCDNLTAKVGTQVYSAALEMMLDPTKPGIGCATVAIVIDETTTIVCDLTQNMLKVTEYVNYLKAKITATAGNVYSHDQLGVTLPKEEDNMSVTIKNTGAVSAAFNHVLDDGSVLKLTCTSQLQVLSAAADPLKTSFILYFPPNKNKGFAGFACEVKIDL